jgi:hypothetical protein
VKRSLVTGTVLVLALVPSAGLWSRAEQKDGSDREGARAWMQRKLEYSQKVLAGLTKADFESIKRSATNMNFMGYLEKSSLASTPGYKQQITSFEFANQELIRQAGDKNLEGTTLAFTQLTLSCVQCHKLVRDAKK